MNQSLWPSLLLPSLVVISQSIDQHLRYKIARFDCNVLSISRIVNLAYGYYLHFSLKAIFYTKHHQPVNPQQNFRVHFFVEKFFSWIRFVLAAFSVFTVAVLFCFPNMFSNLSSGPLTAKTELENYNCVTRFSRAFTMWSKFNRLWVFTPLFSVQSILERRLTC